MDKKDQKITVRQAINFAMDSGYGKGLPDRLVVELIKEICEGMLTGEIGKAVPVNPGDVAKHGNN